MAASWYPKDAEQHWCEELLCIWNFQIIACAHVSSTLLSSTLALSRGEAREPHSFTSFDFAPPEDPPGRLIESFRIVFSKSLSFSEE